MNARSWTGRVAPSLPIGLLVATLFLLPGRGAGAESAEGGSGGATWLASIRPSPTLQAGLDRTIDRLVAADRTLDESSLRVSVIDLDAEAGPTIADRHGDVRVYPASVVKFVYLMAAYAWRDEGRLLIDPELDRQLHDMIYQSSNKATQKVVARITGTEPGPVLPPDSYREFRDRRLSVKRWLASLGIHDLHCLHPTYDGDGDLHGRDQQLLRDETVEGGLPAGPGEFPNRQAMTANDTARLLALLATDRALAPASSAEVRRRMLRDPDRQPYLVNRIAGGARRCSRALRVESKTGTFGRITADAGIVRNPAGRRMVVVAFIDSNPRHRGSFIADLTRSVSELVLGCDE